uniref:DNA helicase n=1 Tax=Tanacetum cinerariifolium TaxID=118510 RepID=A0A6L2LTK9_TANCI|nr:DNA helicase [Tanacetum cinerariifolium]
MFLIRSPVIVLYTTEFQKRGLPHYHTLLGIDESLRVCWEEDIDMYVLAELPSEDVDPECYRFFLEFMMHMPCGLACPSASCMQNSARCKKNFPKEYCNRRDRTDASTMAVATSTSRPRVVVDEIRNFLDARYLVVFQERVRLAYVHPAAGDLVYKRMLLCHQKGCRIFLGIRTVNDVVYPTCKTACKALGLLKNDQEWEIMLEEAALTATLVELRTLLVHILTFCQVSDPIRL